MDRPALGERKGQHCADGRGLDDRTERLVKVHAGTLGEATEDPAGLVLLEGAIGLVLVLENPLPGDDVGSGRTKNQIPGVILQEGSMFFLHSRPPIWIGKGAMEGRGDWGERCCVE